MEMDLQGQGHQKRRVEKMKNSRKNLCRYNCYNCGAKCTKQSNPASIGMPANIGRLVADPLTPHRFVNISNQTKK